MKGFSEAAEGSPETDLYLHGVKLRDLSEIMDVKFDVLVLQNVQLQELKETPACNIFKLREAERSVMNSLKGVKFRCKKVYINGIASKTHLLGLVKHKVWLGTPATDHESVKDARVQEILNKYSETGDVLGAQEELIEAGFEEQAQL